jgi:hypothetical protein
MRDALKKQRLDAYGIAANEMIKHYMTPSSYEDFKAIVDLYPEHVVELSIYSICLGNISGRNSIIWEVRKY